MKCSWFWPCLPASSADMLSNVRGFQAWLRRDVRRGGVKPGRKSADFGKRVARRSGSEEVRDFQGSSAAFNLELQKQVARTCGSMVRGSWFGWALHYAETRRRLSACRGCVGPFSTTDSSSSLLRSSVVGHAWERGILHAWRFAFGNGQASRSTRG